MAEIDKKSWKEVHAISPKERKEGEAYVKKHSIAKKMERSHPEYSRMARAYKVQEGKTTHYFNDKTGAHHFSKTGKTLKGQESR